MRRLHALLAELCGYHLIEDDETGEDELVPARGGQDSFTASPSD